MATLLQARAKAQEVTSVKLVEALFKFIKSIETELTAFNYEQLHKESEGIEGEALGFYTKATEFITTNDALLGRNVRIKKAGEPYDLKQTGEFLEGLYAKVTNQQIIFGSTDTKTAAILGNKNLLTQNLFGLTDANLTQAIKLHILPFYQLDTKKRLGLI